MFLAAAFFAMFYQPTPTPEFSVIPAPVQIHVTSATYADIKGYYTTPAPITSSHENVKLAANVRVAETSTVDLQAPTPECYSYTSCLEYQHRNDPAPTQQQEGYRQYCPDGTPSQGSCSDPGGVK